MNRIGLLLFLVTLPLAGQQSSKPSPEEMAETLWDEFRMSPWDATYESFRSAHPRVTCQQFRGTGDRERADEQWCFRCSRENRAQTTEWSFYDFHPEKPLQCSLQQYRARVTGLPLATLEEIHRTLVARLTSSYGTGEEPTSRLDELGWGYWEKVRRWRTEELEIYLYIEEWHSGILRLTLLARHRPLLEARAEDKHLEDIVWNWVERFRSQIDQKLAQELGDNFPSVKTLLAQGRPGQEEIRATLLRVLEIVKTASPQQQPALLLAADHLGEQVYPLDPPAGPSSQESKQLFGLTYLWNPFGHHWEYGHDLLYRVWQEYGTTEWGERALVLLLNMGCKFGACCPYGTDQFRFVIEHGEKFLAERPHSLHRVAVLFALAQAYETWWSLSQASEGGQYVDSSDYQQGAEPAREKAIARYEELVRLAPERDEAAVARRRLPRLRLSIDTNQRRFFCIWD